MHGQTATSRSEELNWCPRDRGHRLRGGGQRQATGAELSDRPRRGRDAVHVHAGGIGRHLRDHGGVLVLGLESQFSPARHDLGAQAQRAAELLGRGHGLLGGLAVDVEDAGKSEDKVATLRQRHVSFPQSADAKAPASWPAGAEGGEPRRAPDMQDAQCGPLVDASLAT